MTATTMAGLEEILAGELRGLGAENVKAGNRMVAFEGDQEVLYKANYRCRTAIRILLPIKTFSIKTQENLYSKAKAVPWEQYLQSNATFAINEAVSNSVFTHSQFAVFRLKDAIADRFREKTGKRPSVDIRNPSLVINLHMSNNQVTLSLDSSGHSLHKRNYRSATGPAPLNEVLAAGLIMLTGWKGETDFYDPMCGSGTLLIEAAMIAWNIPPGYYREGFGFQQWSNFNKELWDKVKMDASAQAGAYSPEISGFDASNTMVRIARQNLRNARMHKDISVHKKDFFKLKPAADQGILIMNPPYDTRMKEEDIVSFYRSIGDALKNNFAGFTAWIFSGNLDALKNLGLKPSRRIVLFNGPIESRLARYDLYKGSKR